MVLIVRVKKSSQNISKISGHHSAKNDPIMEQIMPSGGKGKAIANSVSSSEGMSILIMVRGNPYSKLELRLGELS
jgi:hypothetical protein